jgi:hypothetical protein
VHHVAVSRLGGLLAEGLLRVLLDLETAVVLHFVVLLRLRVLVEGPISHRSLGQEIELLEEFLDAAGRSGADRKPIFDSVLDKGDLTGYGNSLSEGPDSHFLKVPSIELLLGGLYDNPPVRRIPATVINELKSDSHIVVAIFNK